MGREEIDDRFGESTIDLVELVEWSEHEIVFAHYTSHNNNDGELLITWHPTDNAGLLVTQLDQ